MIFTTDTSIDGLTLKYHSDAVPVATLSLSLSLSLSHTHTHTHIYTRTHTHMMLSTDTSTDGSTLKFHSDAVPFANLEGTWVISKRDDNDGGGLRLTISGPLKEPKGDALHL